MAAAVTNPFKLTWGSFVVGGTEERLIVGVHRIARSFATWEATFDVLVRGTSDSTFAANCAELESEFSKRRLLILFQVGSSTLHTFNPADGTNTGLDSYARIDKAGTVGADTDRSRLYTVTVGCQLPATDASGRRDNPYTIEYLPSRQRLVTFTGEWTANGSNGALAQYQSASPARFTSVLTSIDAVAVWERIGETVEPDDQNKVLRFSSRWLEVIATQPGGSPDSSSLVNPLLTYARNASHPGDSGGGGVKRLEIIDVHFSCAIDKTVTQDADAAWTDTVKPYLRTQVQTLFAPTSFAFQNVRYVLSPFDNTFTADLSVLAAIDPTDVIESVLTNRIVESADVVLTGAWKKELFCKYVDQGIGTRLRFGIRAVRVLGSIKPTQRVGGEGGTVFGANFVNPNGGLAAGTLEAGGPVPEGGIGGGGRPGINGGVGGSGGWILKDNDSASTTKTVGEPGADQITYTDLVETTVEEWVVAP